MKSILAKSSLGINENNIADILSQKCLNSTFKQTGKKGSISLDRYLPVNQKPQAILNGTEYSAMTDVEKKEVEAYKISQKIKNTLISYLPYKKIKEIEKYEQQNVRKYKELCLGENIITEKNLEEFKNFLGKTKSEIDKNVYEISQDWDNIVKKFISDISTKYPWIDIKEIEKVAAKKIGTERDFINSYSQVVTFKPLPNSGSIAYMPQNLQGEASTNINKEAERELIDAIGTNLDNLFQGYNKILWSNYNIKKLGGSGEVSAKTKGTVANATALADNNLSFLGIFELDDIISKSKRLINLKDDKTLVKESQNILFEIFNFCKKEQIESYIDLSSSFIVSSAFQMEADEEEVYW